ncbi:MAG: dihydroorotate dehydrogenase electron transfer subunit [Christensenellaceae bacterium]|jgi:dihydroorotate dehydrogenase electron transfer subunit|nr:dihydroorotate dehydrogenase electron transfer subunit [Christensenellaceae bacterium]
MKNVFLTVKENRPLTNDFYKMVLEGECSGHTAGMFVNIKLQDFTLRRPFGIADADNHSITLLYKVVGLGTKYMTTLQNGVIIDVLTCLGNGFNLGKASKPLLIGGGTGIAPLFKLAKELKSKYPNIILGFRTHEDVCMIHEFSEFGNVHVTTDDGSYGYKGNVLSYLKSTGIVYDYYYACGPLVMLKNLTSIDKNGELSLESRMGCGFGACMGCSIKTKSGYKRVCKEGPVFNASEVIFDEQT